MVITSCTILLLGILASPLIVWTLIVWKKNEKYYRSFFENLKNNIKIPNFQLSAGLTVTTLFCFIVFFGLLKTDSKIHFINLNIVAKKCKSSENKEKIAIFHCSKPQKVI